MEKFNLEKHWTKFKRDELVINCKTEELARELLTYCHGEGMTWITGIELTKNNWTIYREGTCYYCFGNEMQYGSLGYSQEYNHNMVEFDGFNPKPKQYIISDVTSIKLVNDKTDEVVLEINRLTSALDIRSMSVDLTKEESETLTKHLSIPTTTTREIIEVIYHRSETIVLIKTVGKHYKGVSRCDPLDTYSKEFWIYSCI